MYWSGYGNLVSKNGTYPLFISFYPASHSSSQLHLDGLRPTADTRGTAWLCTGSGVVHRLSLSGTIYGGWSSTESSLMRIRLGEFRPIDLGQHTGYFDLYGRWRGPQLVMEDRGSYSSVYSFGLKVEKASVTFDWGGYSDFKTVCASTPNLRQH
jgi:hypothetical protein